MLEKYNYGPLFTPPSIEKPTILMPGYRRRRQLGWCGVRPRDRDHVRPVNHDRALAITMVNGRPVARADTLETPARMETLQGVPLWKPPYGRITAIDLQHGRSPVDGTDG